MAGEQWHELRLEVRVDEVDGVEQPQLVPWVDGSVLALDLDTRADSESSGLGMDPDELLDRRSPLLPVEPADSRELDDKPPLAIVWRCSCREPGCASIGLRVHRDRDSVSGYDAVIWDDWRIRFDGRRGLKAPGALRFDARSYYSEFIRAQASRSWDNVPRQTARELAAILDARPELLARWGAALLFAGGYRHYGRGVIQMWLRYSSGRYELMLPCSATADPVALAQHITEQILRTDPATWEACRPIQGL